MSLSGQCAWSWREGLNEGRSGMMRRAPFGRTFLEASLPAWLILALLLAVEWGQMSLLDLLAILFIPTWGALRLKRPGGSWLRRLGQYISPSPLPTLNWSAILVVQCRSGSSVTRSAAICSSSRRGASLHCLTGTAIRMSLTWFHTSSLIC